MNKINQSQNGIIHLLVLIALVLIVIVGIETFRVISHEKIIDTASNTAKQSSNLEQSLTDILPSQPESRGDIPKFVALLRVAKSNDDDSVCSSLPSAEVQTFWFDDYSASSPSTEDWGRYCSALVKQDPATCQTIGRFSHPNLRQECQLVLEKVIQQKNNSYTVCYEYYGSLYTESDEVHNCLLKYKTQLGVASVFYKSLDSCLSKSNEPVDHGDSQRASCLYDLAISSKDKKLCQMISVPYPAYKASTPNCLSALQQL